MIKILLSIAAIAILAGCAMTSEFMPSSVMDTLTTNGCNVQAYHHDAKRQQIDIKCK